MPRGIDLYIPFSSRISPDVAAAHVRHLDWPCSFGLLDTEEARQRHARARYAEVAARFNPLATGADLDLSVDQVSWFFLFDDIFDGPGGAPHPARRLVEAATAVLGHPPSPKAEPIVHALADVWRRTRAGMSPTWRARAATHWCAYLAGYLDEAENRERARQATLPEYLRIRRNTIGVQPALDLAERIGRFEVPPRAFASKHLIAMRLAITDLLIFQNDLCSLEKEEAVGDLNNTVLILEREHACGRSRAIDLTVELVRRRSESYLALERELPVLCRDLNPIERAAIERYATDALRCVARGNYDWSERTDRYSIECIDSTLSTPRSLLDS
jgi:pentalenene synthase